VLNSVTTSGNITLGATTTQTGTLAFSSTGLTTPATFSLASDTTLTTNVATTINNVISGSANLTKAGAASLTFGTTNTYSGDTVIQAGTINIGSSSTLGDGTGTLKLSGGTLNTTASRSISTAIIPNNVSVTADSAITTTSNAGTVTARFSGTLTGTGGTLTIRNDGAATTGVFDVSFSGGNYTMSRPIILDNGAGGGSVRLSDFNTAGTTHTYDGIISGNGNYSRTASSAGNGGTTIFSANNTYTGTTTVSAGTLLINGDQSSANGAVTVSNTVSNTGSLLGGVGTIGGSVTVGSLGNITGATNGTVGTLTMSSSLTFAGTSGNLATYIVDLTAATSDRLVINGNLSLATAFDQLIFQGTTGAASYTIATYTGTLSGVFDVFTPPSGYAVSYAIPGEIDLVAVPEPSTWIGGALALLAVGYTQRKRFSKAGRKVG
jgi:fibronectin-binding autotransporter adhesin